MDQSFKEISQKEKMARYKLARTQGIGPVKFRELLEYFKSAQEIFLLTDSELQTAINPVDAQRIIQQKKIFDIDSDLKVLIDREINFVVLGQPEYPELLMNATDPPPILYYRGDLRDLDLSKKVISVVGTRNVTPYGIEMTRVFISGLVSVGFTIISGMAFGVDTLAHTYCMDEGGKTVAVLASSVDCPTPKGNTYVYKRILENNGVIFSEYYPGVEMSPGLFPRRNRLIASLSMGTLVIEAGEKSGALITADLAFREGRQVFAVPGRTTNKYSKGTNVLIKTSKAKLVESVDDLLIEFGYIFHPLKAIQYNPKNELEKEIISVLSIEELTADQITNELKSKVSIKDVLKSITNLELNLVLSRHPDGRYYLKK